MTETSPIKPTGLTLLTFRSLVYGIFSGVVIYLLMTLDEAYKITPTSILQCVGIALVMALMMFLFDLVKRQNIILATTDNLSAAEITKLKRQVSISTFATLILMTIVIFASLVSIIARTLV